MNTKDESTQRKIDDLKSILEDKKEELVNFELNPDDYEDQYNDMLDECYPELFNMQPSRILRECDPIAYRCGLLDYIDGLDVSDDTNYQDLAQEIEELESEIEELESEIEDLENE